MPTQQVSPAKRSFSNRRGFIGSFARFWNRSYAPDYVAFTLLAAGWVLIQLFAQPSYQMFSLDNISIQYPFAVVERVPPLWSIVYSGLVPLAVIISWALLLQPGRHNAHITVLGLLVTLAMTFFLTDVVKNAVGRPRPDLISRCKPAKGTPEIGLVTVDVCTQTDQHILHEGWRSFPSGHSSFSFAGLGFLAFFFAGQMHVFRPRTDITRALAFLAPLLGALMVALSRLADYRHDVYDVTCGSLLGVLTAYFCYRRYYPSIWSSNCDAPYERGNIPMADGFRRLAEDEESLSYDNNSLNRDSHDQSNARSPRREMGQGQNSSTF